MKQPEQRWVKPLEVSPGHWKKQLATKILAIAAKGQVSGLRVLLNENPKALNQRGNHGRTLLWEAVRAGKLNAVKFLVEAGANVELTGCFNSETMVQISPLCAALHYRRSDVAAFLKPLVKSPDIFQAAFMGDRARVQRLLTAEPSLLNAEDPDNEIYFTPPLAFAVAGGQRSVVELLLNAGAETTIYSAQLLHLAAALGSIDLLELLRARGAKPKVADAGIFLVAQDLETMRWLLDHGVSVDRAGMSGFPPFVYLARGDKGGTLERMAALVGGGANIDAKGPGGKTALHYAAAAGAVLKVEFLLARGADRNALDDAGNTPLDLALAARKVATAELLRRE